MNEVEIYIKNWCGYCALVEELLSRKRAPYQVIDITNDTRGQADMTRRTGLTSVPQIFIAGEHIGGSDKLIAAELSGQLDDLLEKPREKK